MTPGTATAESTNTRVQDIARVCHEANRAYCETLGDHSQPTWEDAPDWQRESAMCGVALIITNPLTTPEQSHEGWLEQKRRDGWTYGPTKDPVAKTHPCFLPYNELPAEQRIKDHIFGAVVRAQIGIGNTPSIPPPIAPANKEYKSRTETERLTLQNVEHAFTYQPWNDDQQARGKEVTSALIHAARTILLNVPGCPTRTRALNNLVDARMLANAAITHDGRF